MADLDPLDPQETKDYAVAWAGVLTAQGDTTISTSSWGTSVPAGLTVSSVTTSGTNAVVWLSGAGAEPGRTYGLTNRITSNGGRTHRRTIHVPVRPL